MRDLLFKNLTSEDKRRKIIASSEIVDKDGVRNIIRRHFICLVKEINDNKIERPKPYLYVLKEHNNRDKKERFFCKIKGSVCAVSKGKLFLIVFMHSLSIVLTAIPQHLMKYKEE
jgi:hypothetical protein